MTTDTYKAVLANPSAAILALLTERESVLVSGAYVGHVLALQCRGLVTSKREGHKLRITRNTQIESALRNP